MAYYTSNEPYDRVDSVMNGALIGGAAVLVGSSVGMGVSYARHKGIPKRFQGMEDEYLKGLMNLDKKEQKVWDDYENKARPVNASTRQGRRQYNSDVRKNKGLDKRTEKKLDNLIKEGQKLDADYSHVNDPNYVKNAQADSVHGKYVQGKSWKGTAGRASLIGLGATAIGAGIGAGLDLAANRLPE